MNYRNVGIAIEKCESSYNGLCSLLDAIEGCLAVIERKARRVSTTDDQERRRLIIDIRRLTKTFSEEIVLQRINERDYYRGQFRDAFSAVWDEVQREWREHLDGKSEDKPEENEGYFPYCEPPYCEPWSNCEGDD